MERSTGGILIAFAGLVLVIAAMRGTLKNVWEDLVPPTASGGTVGTAPAPNVSGAGGGSIYGPNILYGEYSGLYSLPAGYPGTGNQQLAFVPQSTE